MSPRDAYLAWQAEIGTEEVVLAKPLDLPARKAVSPPQTNSPFNREPNRNEAYGSETIRVRESRPIPAMPSPNDPDFFQAIAKSLIQPAFPASKKPARATPAASPSSPPAFPEFAGLEEYWKFLGDEYPQWFPGVRLPLARAEGHARPRLAVVELFPAEGTVFGGEPGIFFDKMMKAIGLDRSAMYLTSVMKAAPAGRQWLRKDVARVLPLLFQELRLAGCGLVLLAGETCAQAVLRSGESLDALHQRAVEAEGLAFAAAHHPADLLKDESLKRKTWENLQWVQARLPKGGS